MRTINEICPLANNDENHEQRYCPKNAKHAYCFQFHDTLRVLLPLAVMNDTEAWNKQLDVLQTQINSARKI